jgi:hypothetical protein
MALRIARLPPALQRALGACLSGDDIERLHRCSDSATTQALTASAPPPPAERGAQIAHVRDFLRRSRPLTTNEPGARAARTAKTCRWGAEALHRAARALCAIATKEWDVGGRLWDLTATRDVGAAEADADADDVACVVGVTIESPQKLGILVSDRGGRAIHLVSPVLARALAPFAAYRCSPPHAYFVEWRLLPAPAHARLLAILLFLFGDAIVFGGDDRVARGSATLARVARGSATLATIGAIRVFLGPRVRLSMHPEFCAAQSAVAELARLDVAIAT